MVVVEIMYQFLLSTVTISSLNSWNFQVILSCSIIVIMLYGGW